MTEDTLLRNRVAELPTFALTAILLLILLSAAGAPAQTLIYPTKIVCVDRVTIEAAVGSFAGVNQPMTVTGTIHVGITAPAIVPWLVRVDGAAVQSGTYKLAAGATATISARWLPPNLNPHTLEVVLDPDNTLLDCDRTNNLVRRSVGAPQVASLSLSPVSLLSAGTTASLTATLTGPAAVPVTVTVASGNPSLVSAANCVVPASQLSCAGEVRLLATVTTATTVPMTARVGSPYKSTPLNIAPISINSLEAIPFQIRTSGRSQITATLFPSPTSPAVVSMTSSRPDLIQIDSCTVYGGGTYCSSYANLIAGVTSTTPVTITASLGSSTKTASLTLQPPVNILTVLPNPPSLVGLYSTTRVVVNIASAAASPLAVDFSTSRPDLIEIGDCTIQAGQTGCQVSGKLLATVAAPVSVMVTASISGVQKSSELLVNPIAVQEFSVARSGTVAFNYSATVKLNANADRSFPVAVTSSHPAIVSDFTITVPTGSSVATVSGSWNSPSAETNVTLTAGGKSSVLVAYGPAPGVFQVSPTSWQGPLDSPQQITLGCSLTNRAPGPVTFSVISSHPALVAVPPTITLTGTTVNMEYFPAQLNPFNVTSSVPVTLTVSNSTMAKSVIFWLRAPQ